MSRFLKALAMISPDAAMKRMRAQEMLRAYDAAQNGRRTASFRLGVSSANAEIGRALPALRERSSELVRNSPLGSRPLAILKANVVGTDLTVRFDTGEDKLDRTAQQLFDDWAQMCDMEGETSFTGLVALAFSAALERGDAIVRMRTMPLKAGLPVPLLLHVGEGDLIDETRDVSLFSKGSRARLGVELGDNDQRLGYWLHRSAPGEPTRLGQNETASEFVPRADVCHIYHRLRPGQVRGVPLLTPVLLSARDFADLMDALIVKERMQAAIGLIVESPDASASLPGQIAADSAGDSARQITKLAPGTVNYTRPGEKVTPFVPAGNSSFQSVSQAVLHLIAAGAGVTYDELTGDTSLSNYTGLRQGKIAARRLIEEMQWHMLVPQLIRRITDRFIDHAILAGRLPDRPGGYPRKYVMPAHEPIDPLKDMQADILAVRAGRMSPQDFAGSWGRDWRVVMKETQDFFAAADDAGLVFDIDARQRTRTGADASPPSDQMTKE